MKALLTIAISLLAFALQAQRPWQLFDPEEMYYFQEDSTNLLHNLQASSVRNHQSSYEIDLFPTTNRTFPPRSGLNDTFKFYLPSALGYSILIDTISEETYFNFENDSIKFSPKAQFGDTAFWWESQQLFLRVDSLYVDTVLGISDSIKSLSLNNREFLVWSKTLGIVKFPYQFQSEEAELSIIGLESKNYGWQFPSVSNLFSYQIGDTLVFNNWSGSAEEYYTTDEQVAVVNRWERNDSLFVDATIGRKLRFSGWGNPFPGGTNESFIRDTIVLTYFINRGYCVIDCNIDIRRISTNSMVPTSRDGSFSTVSSIPVQVQISDTFPFLTYNSDYQQIQVAQNLFDSCEYFDIDSSIALFNPFSEEAFYNRTFCEEYSYSNFEHSCGRELIAYKSNIHPNLNFGQTLAPHNFDFINRVSSLPLSLHPNPTSSTLHLSYPEAFDQAQVLIYDMLGQVVLNATVSKQESDLDVSSLSEGYYILEMQLDEQVMRERFLVSD